MPEVYRHVFIVGLPFEKPLVGHAPLRFGFEVIDVAVNCRTAYPLAQQTLRRCSLATALPPRRVVGFVQFSTRAAITCTMLGALTY